jgi:hypothetical protein
LGQQSQQPWEQGAQEQGQGQSGTVLAGALSQPFRPNPHQPRMPLHQTQIQRTDSPPSEPSRELETRMRDLDGREMQLSPGGPALGGIDSAGDRVCWFYSEGDRH